MNIYLCVKNFIDEDYKIVWKQDVKDEDVLGGMVAGGNAVVLDSCFILGLKNIGVKIYKNDDESYDDITKVFGASIDVSSYIYYMDINIDDLDTYPITELQENDYAFWIKNGTKDKYNLYKFNNINFIKGIIYICELLKLNWLEYIYDRPFNYKGDKFNIPGILFNNPPPTINTPIDDENDLEDDGDETFLNHKEE